MKSQNVLLTRNWDIAKIADAGVARFAQAVDVIGNEGVASMSSVSQIIFQASARITLLVQMRLCGSGTNHVCLY